MSGYWERSSSDKVSLKINDLTKNPLLKSFLQDKQNLELLLDTLNNPSRENKKRLDSSFKNFFFEIRFTSYISSLIHFSAIDFDKRKRREKQRMLLVEDGTLVESFSINHENLESQSTLLEDIVTNERLFSIIKSLTEKEKNVLIQRYIFDFTDTQIAEKLSVSQQAVSKMRKRALNKLKKLINE